MEMGLISDGSTALGGQRIQGFQRRWWQQQAENPIDEGELPLTALNKREMVAGICHDQQKADDNC